MNAIQVTIKIMPLHMLVGNIIKFAEMAGGYCLVDIVYSEWFRNVRAMHIQSHQL